MIGVKWIGWDESEWDFQSGDVRLMTGGVEGFNSLEAETFVQTTALVDGQRFTGWRAKARPLLLPVLIGQAKSPLEWVELDKRWWKTMQVHKFGRLEVTAPDGTVRFLHARFVSDGQSFDHDPSHDRLAVAAIEMMADDPWWKGAPFRQSFSAGAASQNYYGGAEGFGPPYIISDASTLGDAEVNNPGDVNAWPKFRIDGPSTAFVATIDGFPVAANMELAGNQQLQIDTAPNKQTAWLITGGTLLDSGERVGGIRENRTRQLAEVQFRPIPSGASARLSVSINGTGKITLSAEPRYFKAW